MPQALISAIRDAFQSTFGFNPEESAILLEPTNENFEGDLTLVVFPFLRQTKMGPEASAQKLGEALLGKACITGFNVVKGFLNLSLSSEHWLTVFRYLTGNEYILRKPSPTGKTVMVEFSSPNTNKPLHLGHVRNNVLGESVSRILKAVGHEVVKVNLINDRGIHICKSMAAWMEFGEGETPASSGLKGDHLVGKYYVRFNTEHTTQVAALQASGMTEEEASEAAPLMKQARELLRKWEEGDSEVVSLWKKMNAWVYAGFDISYERMGVSFDKYYYESDTYLLGKDMVLEGLEKGVFERESDGSVWADLTQDKLDRKILLRADGTSVYITQDIGTAQLKYDNYRMDQSIYVVGNEQEYHFKVLKALLEKLKKPHALGIHHLSYGMVDLPSGKMKSREGTVVDADDLMDEMVQFAKDRTAELGKTEGLNLGQLSELHHNIGMSALKFFLLKVDAKKKILFNPEESIDFNGFTGPFIQYTYARISSIRRKAKSTEKLEGVPEMSEFEVGLIKNLEQFPPKLTESATQLNPAILAQYIYSLAKAFNRFYHEHSILNEPDENKKNLRLALSVMTGRVLKQGLQLLGIEPTDRM